jgi:hypothetical protein
MAIKIIGSTIIDDSRNIVNAGIATVTSVSIGNTQVVSSARQLQNIASLDATTTATIEAAIQNAPNTFADLNVTGISTLGITSATNLTAQQLNVSGISTFQSSNLKVVGASTSFQYSILGSAIVANRNLTLPLIAADDTIAVLGTSQTFGNTQTFNGITATGQVTLTSTGTNAIILGSSLQTGTITVGQATGSQTTNIQAGASGVGTTKTINFGTGGLSGSFTQINIGPNSGIGTILIGTGTRLGIGSAIPTAALDVVGDGRVSGVVTATTFVGALTGTATTATKLETARTFQITGDVVASAISFDGTGNVSLAATIQPNSVALGSDTTGDYVANITGTSNQITVTSGTGEGSTPTLSIPSQFTAPQDVTVTRDLQVNRNLNVTGNVTIGGTTAFINVPTLTVFDPDIVLGYRTDGNGNDISNDTTSNHGGVALASTEGTPLVNLFIAGIETNPATYKKIMWFKSGTFSGLGTDAWLINYAVGIGSTQFPTGTRLAAGNVQFTQNDLAVVRNINASGVGTIPTLSGTTATYTTGNFTTGNIVTGIVTNISGTNLNYTGVGTITRLNSTNATLTNINSSGISTLGITTFTGAVSFGSSAYFGDNDFAYFGDAGDLYIGHNGSVSAIADAGTGDLYIAGDNSLIITDLSYAENKAKFNTNGSVELYFDNVREFETTGYGATVYGILQSQGLQVSGISTFTQISAGGTTGLNQYVLSSTGTGLSWQPVTSVGGGTLSGIVVQDEGSTVGTAGSITTLNFVGTNVTASAVVLGNIATITVSDTPNFNTLRVTGVSTFTNGPVFIGAATSTGTASQRLQVTGGAYVSDNVGIGTTNPGSKLTVNGSVQIQQDSGSNNRFILRGQPASLYRWNIDNFGSANDFRIFREDDVTAANGVSVVSISTSGTLTATRFSGDASLLTNLPSASPQWVTTSVGVHTLSNVGIGTTNPTSRLTVSGNASITGILTADQVYTSNNGTGQNIRIGDDLWIGDINAANTTRFSGAQNSDTAFIIFGSSNTVALGRTGTGPLYYGGDFTISGVATANSFRARGGAPGALGANNNGYGFFAPGDNDSGMYSSADGQIEFYTNNTEAVRIDSNQRVGIGTTNPTSTLTVQGNALITGISAIANLSITPVGTGATVGGIGVTYYGDGSQLTGVSGGFSISTNTTNQVQFITYAISTGSTTGLGVSTTKLVFNPSSGNLGIGTTNPQYIFTVTDTGTPATTGLTNCLADFTTTANSYGQINLRNTSTGTNASSDVIITANNGTDSSNFIDLGINNSGFSVGSWTINGPTDGYLYTSDTNLSIGVASATRYLSFFTGGTLISNERMRINTTGVGIGTTNPTSRLTVQGDSLITGVSTFTNARGTNINFTGVGTIATLGSTVATLTNATGTNINFSGIGTIGTLRVASGIVSATTGILTYYGDGSPLVDVSFDGYNTGITSAVSATLTAIGGNIITLPSTAGREYIIYSINCSNVAVGNTEVNVIGAFDINSTSERSYFAYNIPIPTGTAVELLKQPQVLSPSDRIIMRSTDYNRVGIDTGVQVYISYREVTTTKLFGIGIGTVSIGTSDQTNVYTATSPSLVQSIRLVNRTDSGAYPVSVRVISGVTTINLVDNLLVPKYGSVEILDTPKRLNTNDILSVQLDQWGTVDVQVSGKLIS